VESKWPASILLGVDRGGFEAVIRMPTLLAG
jgi:hypothetical protein